MIKLALLWAGSTLVFITVSLAALITSPGPLFAYSLQSGKIIVASDRPIPALGGVGWSTTARACSSDPRLKRSGTNTGFTSQTRDGGNSSASRRLGHCVSPLSRNNVFLTGADFNTGRLVHRGYIGTPPRTLAYLCAHELTHIIEGQHIGIGRFLVPQWAWEGLADYVGIEHRETFEQLRNALGDRPDDAPTKVKYGSHPRYRLLVTFHREEGVDC